jgi:heme oxygenase
MSVGEPAVFAGTNLLSYLRSETRSSHTQIELVMGLEGDFTIARYVQALQTFEAYLTVWEPAISAVLNEADRKWFLARSRTAWAQKDLACLHANTRHDAVSSLKIDVPSRSFAYGAMYVIEGSSLGGEIIAERVRLRHGLEPHTGALFFGGRGEKAGVLWREFRLRLTQEVGIGEADYAQAKAGAVATFDGLTTVANLLVKV